MFATTITALLLACSSEPIPTDPSDGLMLSFEGPALASTAGFQVFRQEELVKAGQVIQGITTKVEGLLDGPYRIEWQRMVSPALGLPFTWDAADDLVNIQGGSGAAIGDYHLSAGAVTIAIDGLPSGEQAEWRVNGSLSNPLEILSAMSGSEVHDTLSDLTPGSRAIHLQPLEVNIQGTVPSENYRVGFAPAQPIISLPVVADSFPTVARVSYAQVNGAARVVIAGLPDGARPSFTVLDANQALRTFNDHATISTVDLLPFGDTMVAFADLTFQGNVYQPQPASVLVTIPIGIDPVVVSTSYSPRP
jgi:hypothetical protein